MRTYKVTADAMAGMAFANCLMLLENAIAMSDSYIEEHYGSDSNMCEVAERYFDLGCKILNTMPPCGVAEITRRDLHVFEEEDHED